MRFTNTGSLDPDARSFGMPEDGAAVYYLFDPELEPVSDNIFKHDLLKTFTSEIGGQTWLLHFPFTSQELVSFSETGAIYSSASEEFYIRVHSSDGEYIRSIYHTFPKAPVTGYDLSGLEERVDAYRFALREHDVPDHWPALNLLLVDDEERLWVLTITGSDDHFEWWVLDEEGTLLGTHPWPVDRLEGWVGSEYENMIIKNGALYHLTRNPETDVQHVLKYRIEMN
ncbi:MAG: hypothetical protein WD355_07450 [Balneolaceae bacterium]